MALRRTSQGQGDLGWANLKRTATKKRLMADRSEKLDKDGLGRLERRNSSRGARFLEKNNGDYWALHSIIYNTIQTV